MKKGKKILVLIAAALVTATILMVPAVMAEPEKPENVPDWMLEPPEGAFEWLGDEPTTTNVSGAGLIILVIILFGGSLVAVYLVDKHFERQKETEKRIETMERQLKEQA